MTMRNNFFIPKGDWRYEGALLKVRGYWSDCEHEDNPRYVDLIRRLVTCAVCEKEFDDEL